MLRPDGTAECDCGLPLFPQDRSPDTIHLECANHHHADMPVPAEAALLRVVDQWITRRGAQLGTQHDRWGTDDVKAKDEETI